jgi:hypothetical protein
LWFWLLRVRVPSVTRAAVAHALLKQTAMLNPAVLQTVNSNNAASDFWLRLLNDEALSDCDDLEKLLIGCELIAALDAVDLLAAA